MNDFPVIGDPYYVHRILGSLGVQTLRVTREKCMAQSSFSVKSSVFRRRITYFRRDFVRSGGD